MIFFSYQNILFYKQELGENNTFASLMSLCYIVQILD